MPKRRMYEAAAKKSNLDRNNVTTMPNGVYEKKEVFNDSEESVLEEGFRNCAQLVKYGVGNRYGNGFGSVLIPKVWFLVRTGSPIGGSMQNLNRIIEPVPNGLETAPYQP